MKIPDKIRVAGNETEIKEGYARDITELLMLYGRILEKHVTALTQPIWINKDFNKED